MAKIILNDITNVGQVSVINDNFDKIELEFQNKVLYRDNPDGEPNTIENDVDVNGFDLFNVGTISADNIELDGVDIDNAFQDVLDQAQASADAAAVSEENAEDDANRAEAAAAASAASASDATGGRISLLTYIPEAEHAAIAAGTSTFNCHDAIVEADSVGDFFAPPGVYPLATSVTIANKITFEYGARIEFAAGINMHMQRGYVADDWGWFFDITETGSSATGDAAPMGYVTPQHWGAQPRDLAFDDRPAIEAATEYATLQAIRFEFANSFPVKFTNPGTGFYYKTKTRPIYVARGVHWWGDSPTHQRALGGVEIRAADGLDAVVLAFFPGGNSAPPEYEPSNLPTDPIPGIGKQFGALRSRFSDLTFLPETAALVKYGFVHNTVCFLERCRAGGFTRGQFNAVGQSSGSMLNIYAPAGVSNVGNTSGTIPASTVSFNGTAPVYGSTNGSQYDDCYAQNGIAEAGVNGGSYGFIAHGNVAGITHYIGCDAAGNTGAGFLENTSVGCEYFACHSAQNSWKVSHGGLYYICIKYHIADAAKEPGVGADWRTYWIDVNASIADSAWALAQVYHPSCGINVSTASSRSTVLAHYTEGGIEAGVVARALTEVRGGWGASRTFMHGEFSSANVSPASGYTQGQVGFIALTTAGDANTQVGASLGSIGTPARIASYGDQREDSTNNITAMRFAWNTLRGRYEWTDTSNSNRSVYGVSGTGYTGTGYTAITQSFLYANGMYLADGGSTGLVVVRMRSANNLAAITDAVYGAAVRGDTWIYAQATAGGKRGAVCTTAGTIGTTAVLKEFGAIDP